MVGRLLIATSVPLLCIASTGCSRPKLGAVPVSGKVTYHGTPAKFGSVSFRPTGEQGRPCVASIYDGQYKAFAVTSQEGLAPGEYQVSVVFSEKPLRDTPGGSGVPREVADRYLQFDTSGLTLTVAAGSEPIAYDIELKD